MTSKIDTVIDEVNGIRHGLPRGAGRRDPKFLVELATAIGDSSHLSREPVARALVEDFNRYPETSRLVHTKTHINQARDHHLISLFDVSYFPSLSLDFLSYEPLPTDPQLEQRYVSNTMPVTITACSTGFQPRAVVALFPENHIDGVQESCDLIFYFIDKFVERHKRITRTMIDEVMEPGSFPLIESADDPDLEMASSWWVRLHEYHHHQGDMPIPEYLDAKKLKPLAGLEELRTDISSILACLTDSKLPSDEAQMTSEYILAERLLRYAVEGKNRPNYDAVASQMLFNYLLKNGGIKLCNERLGLCPDLPAVLDIFLKEIRSIERDIHTTSVDDVRAHLLEFTNGYTHYDEDAQDYRHIPYFAAVKRRLKL